MDINRLRADFPILLRKIHGYPLVYLDSAATSQKPEAVIRSLSNFYENHNANVHRAVYTLAEEATRMYEDARNLVARFIRAQPHEVVFTQGATEGINIVAHSYVASQVKAGDEIVITAQEHHSNILPWQELAREHGVNLRVVPVYDDGTLRLDNLDEIITDKTKLVALSDMSNVIGIRNDLQSIVARARAHGARVLIDASQSVARYMLDVKKIDADFLVFSGHKMLGPTGIGVLYIHERLHHSLRPYQVGGGMIMDVGFLRCTWQKMPHLLEAGTPPIANAIGLAAAIKYIQDFIYFPDLRIHEAELCRTLIDGLQSLDHVTIMGPVTQLKKAGHMVSFVMHGFHPHDVAAYLDQYAIAVRAGHHCAQPLAQELGVQASIRISFYAYNTSEEVAFCVEKLSELMAQRAG